MPNPLKKQQGFTVQEMLVVIAITVILLGVSIVGVVAYVRHLQLKELDNAAREIFMAAQNRAILIGSDKVKKAAVKADDQNRIDHVEIIPSEGDEATTQITVYYVHSSDEEAMKELLPQEAIDPALWDGDFTSPMSRKAPAWWMCSIPMILCRWKGSLPTLPIFICGGERWTKKNG